MKQKFLIGLLGCFLFFPVLCFAQIKPERIITQKQVLRIPPQKFLLEKLPPIKFIPCDRSFFKIYPDQKTVSLKNGKTLTVENFLKEVNELEKKLNDLGYTLRDNKIIKVKYILPLDQFKLQKEIFSKDFLAKMATPLPPQVACWGSYPPGRPKDFVPLNWERRWHDSFGNDDFGINLTTNLTIEGEENYLNIDPYFDVGISLFGQSISVLKIRKSGNYLIGEKLGQQQFRQLLSEKLNMKKLLDDKLNWSTEINIPLGFIDIEGTIGFGGKVSVTARGQIVPSASKAEYEIFPNLSAEAFAELGVGYAIVSVGVGCDLTLISDVAHLLGSLELKRSSTRYFEYSAIGNNDLNLLSGKLYIYGEIDYLLGSKKFQVDIFDFKGYEFYLAAFNYQNINVPAEQDHNIWLQIDKINGITPYTARNEKLEIEPQEFEVIVEIDGRSYSKIIKDRNKDGRYGEVLGEYEPLRYKVPLLSFKKIPISIEVIQRYKIGTLDFKNTLDLAPGIWKKVELCYDPQTRSFSGTKSGREDRDNEIRSVGDSSYWGERYHQIFFELGPLKFGAPKKAK